VCLTGETISGTRRTLRKSCVIAATAVAAASIGEVTYLFKLRVSAVSEAIYTYISDIVTRARSMHAS
jgi:hypothetical protein